MFFVAWISVELTSMEIEISIVDRYHSFCVLLALINFIYKSRQDNWNFNAKKKLKLFGAKCLVKSKDHT